MPPLGTSLFSDDDDNHLSSTSMLNGGTTTNKGLTSPLMSALLKSRSRIDSFCAASRAKMNTTSLHNSAQSNQKQRQIDDLRAQIKELKISRGIVSDQMNNDVVGSVAKQRLVLKERQSVLERELADVYFQQKQVQDALQEAEREEKHHHINATEAQNAKLRVEEAKMVTVEDLSLGVLKYRRLGLNFERVTDNTLKFVFTQIDPSDPERKFFFVLSASADDELYEILECHPPLRSGTLLTLVDDLNASSDISGFVRRMRRGFVDIVY